MDGENIFESLEKSLCVFVFVWKIRIGPLACVFVCVCSLCFKKKLGKKFFVTGCAISRKSEVVPGINCF